MADVLLYHHAQGLTPGVLAFAARLRDAGHHVTAPDLYGGLVFSTLDDGIDHARSVGFDRLLELGVQSAAAATGGVVFAGFSLGAMPAQLLAQTRPCAGLLLYHGAITPAEFGGPFPAQVPVQIHAMDHDPWFVDEGDIEAARDIVAATDDGDLFLYPGNGHLFTDESLPGYDQAAAELVIERTLVFLEAR